MSIELNQYLSQNSARQIILSKTLQPMLETIKRNHINSYLQLKSTLSPKNQEYDISKGQEDVFRLDQKNHMLGRVDDRIAMRQTYRQSKRQKGNLTKHQTYYQNNAPVDSRLDSLGFSHNPANKLYAASLKQHQSKIKKHLIQSINFQQISKVLYKKPHVGNMYEAFCNHIRNKKEQKQKQNSIQKSHEQQSKGKSRIPRLLDHDEAVRKCKDSPFCTLDSSFRITNRKKFWKRESSLQNKSPSNPEQSILNISPMKIEAEQRKAKKIRLNEQI